MVILEGDTFIKRAIRGNEVSLLKRIFVAKNDESIEKEFEK